MKQMTVELYLFAMSISGFGQNVVPPDLRKAITGRLEAAAKGDTQTVPQYRADDWISTHSNGVLTDKNRPSLGQQQTPAPGRAELKNEQIKMFGSAAVAIYEYNQPPGGPRTAANIWVKENSGWKTLGGQLTLIGDKPPEKPAAVTPSAEKKNFSGAEQAVFQVHQAIEEASAKRDSSKYDTLTTAGFIRINSNGSIQSKAERLKAVSTYPTPSKISEFDDIKIRVHGDAAVLTARLFSHPASGTPAPLQRMTRLFVKQGGKWLLAYTQTGYVH